MPTETLTPDKQTQSWIKSFGDSLDPAPTEPSPAPIPDPEPAPAQTAPPTPGAAAPAPAAPTPTPPEPPVPEEERWPRTALEWKKFKAERNEQRAKLEVRIKELEDVNKTLEEKSKTPTPVDNSAELDSLKKERDAYSERLRLIAVQKHPKFEAYFGQKEKAQIELAKKIVGAERAEPVAELLALPGGKLRDQELENILLELSPIEQSRMGGVLNALEDVRAEREAEIANASAHYEKLTGEEKAKADTRRKDFESMFDSEVKKVTDPKTGSPVWQTKDGDEAWNSEVKQRVEAAKTLIFGQNKPEVMVQSALNALAYPSLLKALQFATSEAAKLKKQVEELQASGPKLGSEPAPAVAPEPEVKTGTRPMDVMGHWMKKMHQE